MWVGCFEGYWTQELGWRMGKGIAGKVGVSRKERKKRVGPRVSSVQSNRHPRVELEDGRGVGKLGGIRKEKGKHREK